MSIVCPQCKNSIAPSDLSVHTAMATCRNCHHVFGFADQVPNSATRNPKTPVSMPPGFQVHYEGQTFVLTRKWFSFMIIPLVFFCIFWDAFLVAWYIKAFSKPGHSVFLYFPIIHVLAGIAITYATLASLLNRTRITIDPMSIGVSHGPLPWFGNRTLSRTDIKQFFCEEKRTRTKHGYRFTYNVLVIDQAGQKQKFISALNNIDQARFIEQEIEKQLGLRDMAFPGEAT